MIFKTTLSLELDFDSFSDCFTILSYNEIQVSVASAIYSGLFFIMRHISENKSEILQCICRYENVKKYVLLTYCCLFLLGRNPAMLDKSQIMQNTRIAIVNDISSSHGKR